VRAGADRSRRKEPARRLGFAPPAHSVSERPLALASSAASGTASA
jgi:hypothetical protein